MRDASFTSTKPRPDAAEGSLTQSLQHASERAREVAGDVVETVKPYPMATIAVAAGLAFALGALWSMRRPQRSQLERWMQRLPPLPDAKAVRSYWH
ncbi:MAG: hypothetical protein NW223_03740 [Hyphomicrobiaceae bacterium]|nr:hypothetical protein [Hyphomicrobiaceae bacterium]